MLCLALYQLELLGSSSVETMSHSLQGGSLVVYRSAIESGPGIRILFVMEKTMPERGVETEVLGLR